MKATIKIRGGEEIRVANWVASKTTHLDMHVIGMNDIGTEA